MPDDAEKQLQGNLSQSETGELPFKEADTEQHSDSTDTKFTLLLSGGGFRATLFHLGVIRYLRESGKLSSVSAVYSVSGGSIIAAHMALHWSDYTGSETQFDRAASELVAFTQIGLREQIVYKAVLFWLSALATLVVTITFLWHQFEFSTAAIGVVFAACIFVPFVLCLERRLRPISFLETGYRKILGRNTLSDIDSSAPQFHFLSTNLTNGTVCCFTNKGVYPDIQEETPLAESTFIPSDSLRLSECVAASSAFPPLFSPYRLSPRRLKVDGSVFSHTQFLADGGVFDNLAVHACHQLSSGGGAVLVSDAERKFDKVVGSSFRFLTRRASRATDILMHRVNGLEFDLLRCQSDSSIRNSLSARPIDFVRLQNDIRSDDSSKNISLSPDLYRRVRRIRTDLDAFSPVEVQLLYCAGLLAARAVLDGIPDLGDGMTATGGIPSGHAKTRWLPIKKLQAYDEDETAALLEVGERTSWGNQWNLKSAGTWVVFALAAGVLMLNPLSISLIRKLSIRPTNLKVEQILSLSDEIPSEFEMLIAFAQEGMTQQVPPNKPLNFYFVTSAELEDSCFSLTPSRFGFQLDLKTTDEIFYQAAFLYFERTKSVRSLIEQSRKPARFEVDEATGEARLLVLLGVISDAKQARELTTSDLLLKIEDIDVTSH
ncbi:patatin-like phospholipase family protein [Allorhodopirellula solitaria]|uniref:Patatin-like phospholipase n=1 Tax=Allorhodopirellula solitaria TaxID=2527987 RepID=A0A5C5YE08_9BACT|nr:patatin-like phospholipase family protein [Allorhodopirellula solitaria]TWT73976.1 Patatin-like phospholipase [Allorhodopirellula solitaria]